MSHFCVGVLHKPLQQGKKWRRGVSTVTDKWDHVTMTHLTLSLVRKSSHGTEQLNHSFTISVLFLRDISALHVLLLFQAAGETGY